MLARLTTEWKFSTARIVEREKKNKPKVAIFNDTWTPEQNLNRRRLNQAENKLSITVD